MLFIYTLEIVLAPLYFSKNCFRKTLLIYLRVFAKWAFEKSRAGLFFSLSVSLSLMLKLFRHFPALLLLPNCT